MFLECLKFWHQWISSIYVFLQRLGFTLLEKVNQLVSSWNLAVSSARVSNITSFLRFFNKLCQNTNIVQLCACAHACMHVFVCACVCVCVCKTKNPSIISNWMLKAKNKLFIKTTFCYSLHSFAMEILERFLVWKTNYMAILSQLKDKKM